jgi:hypothetical protein
LKVATTTPTSANVPSRTAGDPRPRRFFHARAAHESSGFGHVVAMKRSVVILVLAIAALGLGAFLLIGTLQGDDTDQLEQNQPTISPSGSPS